MNRFSPFKSILLLVFLLFFTACDDGKKADDARKAAQRERWAAVQRAANPGRAAPTSRQPTASTGTQIDSARHNPASQPASSKSSMWMTIGKYALYTIGALFALVLAFILWIGYGVIFGGYGRFNKACKDASLQEIPSAERWAMAVGTPYAIVGDYHWARLVVDSDPEEAERERKNTVESLADMWGIYDRETLFERLLDLLQTGHRTVYEEQIKSDSKMSAEKFAASSRQLEQYAKSSSDAKERLWQLRVARKNRRNVRQLDFCAWDMVRFVMLCNSGAQVGYISEREMVDFSMLAAARVQKHYRSWREVAQQFLLARWYWKATDRRHMISHCLFKRALKRLLKQSDSPWRTLPWDTLLPTGAEATFAEACRVAVDDVRYVSQRDVEVSGAKDKTHY
ncbi:DUF1266 domain-containing protein [Leminorella grimontii]|uniref:DUF1266 domain-containing protein n=1 Tax=Leminorella grimontii TaxID=82981 RepID=UPI00208C1238|nr:DUF1266 domain-containing protein [Leminorella grimontii]GKX60117.1 hypothetical protein SOASR031_24320 [Leminorella grimontii]